MRGITMKLRNFLYLNTKLLDDYLSAIDGYISDTEIHTDSQTNKKSGHLEGGIPVVHGSGDAEKTEAEEIKKEVKITEASKFEKLFTYLDENDLKYYEFLNANNFDELSRDDFMEVLVSPRFSKLKKFTDLAQKLGKFANAMQPFADQPLIDLKAKQALSGFDALGQIKNGSEVSCVFSFEDKEYPLVAYLDEQYFKVLQERFVGEVYMLCKIQRKILKGQNVKLDEIFESFKNMPLNRSQRRKMPKNLNNPSEIKDVVRGPAFVVIPIAVYQ